MGELGTFPEKNIKLTLFFGIRCISSASSNLLCVYLRGCFRFKSSVVSCLVAARGLPSKTAGYTCGAAPGALNFFISVFNGHAIVHIFLNKVHFYFYPPTKIPTKKKKLSTHPKKGTFLTMGRNFDLFTSIPKLR